MSTLTIRLPEEKHQRLKALAQSKNISVNKLIDELATVVLVEHDTKNRFLARSGRATAQDGLALLDVLDEHDKAGH
ncbi:toxin-antitoxin system HicB family antitoxin [Rhizobium hidalgonense]|uniref:Toxin-antitoxin system HicB family antitoxin n=1 Tax=Rhizobium hidalgonense TaxID=1538159 RepID=A0AAJ2LQX3_9HYPH|nr:toxin-antitoxin system HicB family antitoxin [Rhizobium hidalgonense]MDR9778488.1 toxin-antitoxin system HicB family antitoxin [Rhizobium hidalgonense]